MPKIIVDYYTAIGPAFAWRVVVNLQFSIPNIQFVGIGFADDASSCIGGFDPGFDRACSELILGWVA